MENARRIQGISRRLRLTCTGLIYCLPVVCALFWVFFNQFHPPMIPLPVRVDHDLSGLTRFFAFLVDLIPLGVTLYGLQRLKELFLLYERGSIFTERNVECLRSLGKTLIVWVGCNVARYAALSVVLTLENPAGQHMLVIGLYGSDFAGVFVGIVVLMISRVMDEGRRMQEDQSLIV